MYLLTNSVDPVHSVSSQNPSELRFQFSLQVIYVQLFQQLKHNKETKVFTENGDYLIFQHFKLE